MKKLMMMTAAIALMAGMTQAAAVLWNSGVVLDPVSGLSIGTTSGQYLAQIFFYTDALGTTPFAAGGTLTDTTSTFQGKFNGTTADSFTAGAVAGSYFAQMVITSSDNLWVMTSAIVGLAAVPPFGNLNMDFSTGQGTEAGTAGGTTFTGGWEQIPEPTSLALLALGVAAIGLRRRFRM